MALSKKIKTNLGIDATYWKIVDLNINWLDKTSHISLLGWVDKNARDNGLKPLTQRNFDFNNVEFPFIDEEPQNEREIVYIKIKEDDEFFDALDV